jgi:hypothetical protein
MVCQDPTSRAFSGVLDGVPGGSRPCLSLGVTHNTTKSLDFDKREPKFSSEIEVREGDQNPFRGPKWGSRQIFSRGPCTLLVSKLDCVIAGAFE